MTEVRNEVYLFKRKLPQLNVRRKNGYQFLLYQHNGTPQSRRTVSSNSLDGLAAFLALEIFDAQYEKTQITGFQFHYSVPKKQDDSAHELNSGEIFYLSSLLGAATNSRRMRTRRDKGKYRR
ncbi:MAG TPA: hypothetical protein VHA12_00250 [Candidatus Nanoarchaeia archaeon]|nr:hypothetical protein [Candidatus Nanoarchaeia archaeon]